MQIHIRLPFTTYGEINLSGNTVEELFPSLDFLAAKGLIPTPHATAVPNVVAENEAGSGVGGGGAPNPQPEEQQAPAKATRKKAEPKAEAKKDEPKLTVADVTSAVTKLANAKSVGVARELIARYGVGKASEVKPEDYASFIAEANALASAIDADEELPL